MILSAKETRRMRKTLIWIGLALGAVASADANHQ
jgi:hypothetical protein